MLVTELYPIAIAAGVLALVAAAGRRTSGDRWAIALSIVGGIQVVGYVVVARMMYGTGQLLPHQLLFAVPAIAITTKLVVFSPTFIARMEDPTFDPSLDRHTIVAGLVASWLIQVSLGVLYLFPETLLRAAVLWVVPGSPLQTYIWPLLAGVVLAQVTIAGSLYTEPETEVPALSPASSPDTTQAEDSTQTVVITDGGGDD